MVKGDQTDWRLDLLDFGVCEHVRLEIGGLSKSFVAPIVRTHEWPIARVDPDVGAQIEVEAEIFATALEWTLRMRGHG